MTRRTGLLGAALRLGLALPLVAQQSPGAPLSDLDAYVRQAMKDWGIAGAAVAVVKDDSVVFARGYGVRELGKSDSVDARTVFAIGSNTKLFTATLAGMLVDDGKLKWSDPAGTLLPGFQLYDPYVTQQITLGDLRRTRSARRHGHGERIFVVFTRRWRARGGSAAIPATAGSEPNKAVLDVPSCPSCAPW